MICPQLTLTGQEVRLTGRAMDMAGLPFEAVSETSWPEFPYRPSVGVRLAHTGHSLLLHYKVKEDCVMACNQHDNGDIWTDSCVEFFVAPADDGLYYNIECNCIGALLVGCGPDRHDRRRADESITSQIGRWSSLGSEPFPERQGPASWELMMEIPYSVFFRHHIQSLSGQTIRANFYKCGDHLSRPHYLSWRHIDTVRPDFHRPEFFGDIFVE
ncbi:MAG: hypothetical protein IJR64_06725 [Bacteroidales bacterium]|nr:hypothetical protein [Bacteroidales bacterium]